MGLIEFINNQILSRLKKSLTNVKANELSIWSIWMTKKSTAGEIPSILVHNTELMLLVEFASTPIEWLSFKKTPTTNP